jgi:hypothetical protein
MGGERRERDGGERERKLHSVVLDRTTRTTVIKIRGEGVFKREREIEIRERRYN